MNKAFFETASRAVDALEVADLLSLINQAVAENERLLRACHAQRDRAREAERQFRVCQEVLEENIEVNARVEKKLRSYYKKAEKRHQQALRDADLREKSIEKYISRVSRAKLELSITKSLSMEMRQHCYVAGTVLQNILRDLFGIKESPPDYPYPKAIDLEAGTLTVGPLAGTPNESDN